MSEEQKYTFKRNGTSERLTFRSHDTEQAQRRLRDSVRVPHEWSMEPEERQRFKVVDRVVTYCETEVEAATPEEALAFVANNQDIDWSYSTQYDERLSIEATLVTDKEGS